MKPEFKISFNHKVVDKMKKEDFLKAFDHHKTDMDLSKYYDEKIAPKAAPKKAE